ncbi:unnamed protein product [Spirodela intermedia]|uniref:Uncharacterized protein n=1 Tax=Spirodela intermedia TaxID=51605 RepID=A0A7I8KPE2_SPIIN|nr:unnamed protein product [Spirodela intermedia]
MINSSLLLRSNSQPVLLDIPGRAIGAGTGFLGPRPSMYPPAAPMHSSLPNLNHLQQHPPLLPLPLAKSSSLPPPILPGPTRRTIRVATVRSLIKEEKKPTKSPVKPPKGSQTDGTKTQKHKLCPVVDFPYKHKLHPEEDDEADGVYSLSPPPSSLPIPKFSLRTRRPFSSSPWVAETFRGDPSKVDAGASDDLRRLLRL